LLALAAVRIADNHCIFGFLIFKKSCYKGQCCSSVLCNSWFQYIYKCFCFICTSNMFICIITWSAKIFGK